MRSGECQLDTKEKHIRDAFPRINDIGNPEIKEKVISVLLNALTASEFGDIEEMSQWEPLKEKLQISNVTHTNQVVECAIAIAQVVTRNQGIEVDMDTLIASAILHDVDKLLMFEPEKGNTTRMGTYVPHTTIGAHLALKADLPLEVVHAIAAHSPNYSSIAPKSVEAVILYHADLVMTETWRTARKIELSFDLK
jgi:putative nucleotidyltransferase with HDIG domain